jgi:predicted transposase YdaD
LETVLLSKFSQLSRQEIEAMFLVSDIKQTRVYQEAKQEGRQEGREEGRQEGREEGRQNGEMILLIRQLSKRFGKLKDIYIENINSLNIEQLEKLGEALLDFTDINDLETWLKSEMDK